MNTKFFLAVLIASLVAFFGGWVIFGMVFSDYYSTNANGAATLLMKTPTEMWAVAIGNIAWSLLLTWVLDKTGSFTFAKGFSISLWVSFLIILTFDLSMYAFWDIYSIRFLLVDILISSLFWALVGGIAGAILGSGKKVVVIA